MTFTNEQKSRRSCPIENEHHKKPPSGQTVVRPRVEQGTFRIEIYKYIATPIWY